MRASFDGAFESPQRIIGAPGKAERDGKVAKIRARAGESLAVDQVILEFA